MKKIFLFSVLFVIVLGFNTFAQGFVITDGRYFQQANVDGYTEAYQISNNHTNSQYGYIEFNSGPATNMTFKTLIKDYDPTINYTLICYVNGQMATLRYQFNRGEAKDFVATFPQNSTVSLTFQSSFYGGVAPKSNTIYILEPKVW